MSIQTAWLTDHVILTRWASPFTYDELEAGLEQLRIWAKFKGVEIDILLDIRGLESFPKTYPFLLEKVADLLIHGVCRIAILGDERRVRRLAIIAAVHSGKALAQFETEEDALDWLDCLSLDE